ncbi:MAG: hypothetical protein AMS15_03635 [Planctomycetes bacterium DG_23]|nr:MAG: hypothetical protein AMS15_03635 [Planctomycetes bacterium DG_23]
MDQVTAGEQILRLSQVSQVPRPFFIHLLYFFSAAGGEKLGVGGPPLAAIISTLPPPGEPTSAS